MGWLKDLFTQKRYTEYVFEHSPTPNLSPQFVNSGNVPDIAKSIVDRNLDPQDEAVAFHALTQAIRDSPNLNGASKTNAFSEAIIASERAQAERGNITWEEFYQYEKEEREYMKSR